MEKQEQILELFQTLTPSERKDTLAKLAYSMKVKPRGDVPLEVRDIEMWFDSISTEFNTHFQGTITSPPAAVLAKSDKTSYEVLQVFMKASGLDSMKVIERKRVYLILAQLLVKYADGVAKNYQIPLTSKFVLNCSYTLPSLFDEAFPGYLEAGLAKIAILGHFKLIKK